MHWLVETCVLSDERVLEFRDAFTSLSIPCTFTLDIDQPPEPRRPRPEAGASVIAYGSKSVISYATLMQWRPGAWSSASFDYAAVQGGLAELFLNRDAIIAPFDRVEVVARELSANSVFIRPADDNKAFAGAVMKPSEIADWRNGLKDSGYLSTSTFDAVVATPKAIQREWRVVVTGESIAAASLYREGGERNLATGCPGDVALIALSAAKRYRPAPVFVTDIAEVDHGDLAVIEYNAFNSAELYACDIASVIEQVTAAALN